MNKNTFMILEFNKIKNKLKEFTVSDLGKKIIDELMPSKDIRVIKRTLDDTSEAKEILNRSSHVPLVGVYDISDILSKIDKGSILNPQQLLKVSDFLRGSRKMKSFMKSQEYIAPNLSSYSYSITEFKDIEDEINFSIEGGRVSSKASSRLESIRKKIMITEDRIEKKLNTILSSSKYKSYLQDYYISKRNGKYVVPVKASYKNMVDGSVIDKSSTGSTIFIEPSSIGKLSSEINLLRIDEEKEEYQVLSTISGYIALYLKELKINIEAMSEYDFVFAKGKYSNELGGIKPDVSDEDYIKIINGKHPLLEDDAVPLDFEIGNGYRTLMITGPNTGGKTVVLKTVGLLSLMAQSGFHIPVSEGTKLSVFDNVLLDIGDKQSLEMSLSTFSSHIKNIIDILDNIKGRTLILFDEIGTGTDPSEGSALAASILEECYKLGALTLATTHYGKLKEFSNKVDGFTNGCMEFDSETLKPLYKLKIGEGGNSNAFWISDKLGLKESVINKAKEYLQTENDSNSFDFDNKKINIYKRNKKKKSNKVYKEIKYEDFKVGDSVKIIKTDEVGVVYQLEDEVGNLTILLKGEYVKVNRKRVKLFIPKEQLYPDGYDLDNVFLSWTERKIDKDLDRGALTKEKLDEQLTKLKK